MLRRLRLRNITVNVTCILLAGSCIAWAVNYFWKYVHYEITNDATVEQYITPLNIRAAGYVKEIRFTEHQYVHAGDTLPKVCLRRVHSGNPLHRTPVCTRRRHTFGTR